MTGKEDRWIYMLVGRLLGQDQDSLLVKRRNDNHSFRSNPNLYVCIFICLLTCMCVYRSNKICLNQTTITHQDQEGRYLDG